MFSILANKSCTFLAEALISALAELFITAPDSDNPPADLIYEIALSIFFKPTFNSSVLSTVNLFQSLYSGSCLVNACFPLPPKVNKTLVPNWLKITSAFPLTPFINEGIIRGSLAIRLNTGDTKGFITRLAASKATAPEKPTNFANPPKAGPSNGNSPPIKAPSLPNLILLANLAAANSLPVFPSSFVLWKKIGSSFLSPPDPRISEAPNANPEVPIFWAMFAPPLINLFVFLILDPALIVASATPLNPGSLLRRGLSFGMFPIIVLDIFKGIANCVPSCIISPANVSGSPE